MMDWGIVVNFAKDVALVPLSEEVFIEQIAQSIGLFRWLS